MTFFFRKTNNPTRHRKLKGDAERNKPCMKQTEAQDASETGNKIFLDEVTALPANSVLIL